MKKEDFEKLKKLTESKIKFSEEVISQKLIEIPLMYCTYLDLFVRENKELANLKLKKDSLYSDIYKNLKFYSPERWETKNEIESQMFSNPNYKLVVSEINDQQEIVTYLEQTLENIKSLSYNIKHYIEWTKFQNGER